MTSVAHSSRLRSLHQFLRAFLFLPSLNLDVQALAPTRKDILSAFGGHASSFLCAVASTLTLPFAIPSSTLCPTAVLERHPTACHVVCTLSSTCTTAPCPHRQRSRWSSHLVSTANLLAALLPTCCIRSMLCLPNITCQCTVASVPKAMCYLDICQFRKVVVDAIFLVPRFLQA